MPDVLTPDILTFWHNENAKITNACTGEISPYYTCACFQQRFAVNLWKGWKTCKSTLCCVFVVGWFWPHQAPAAVVSLFIVSISTLIVKGERMIKST